MNFKLKLWIFNIASKEAEALALKNRYCSNTIQTPKKFYSKFRFKNKIEIINNGVFIPEENTKYFHMIKLISPLYPGWYHIKILKKLEQYQI